MIDHRSPPPEAEACLTRPYGSSPKGGTVIAEDVVDLEAHERRLRSAGYRPHACRRCGAPMHVHDYRARLLLAAPAGTTMIARFRCSARSCGTVIQVLPALLARHLWRAWSTVEDTVLREDSAPSEVPARTQRRWRARLATAAFLMMAAIAPVADTSPARADVFRAVGHDGTRRDAVVAFGSATAPPSGRWIASLAAFVHRVAPGVRLM